MALLDFTTGTLPAGVTLTRATTGSRMAASGLIVIEPVDTARFEYASGACVGLWNEPAATNQIAPSLDAGAAPWSRTAGLTINGLVSDPKGGNAARRITFTRASSGDEAIRVYSPSNVSGRYVGSGYLRAGDAASVGKTAYLLVEAASNPPGFAKAVTLSADWQRVVTPISLNALIYSLILGYPSPSYFNIPAPPAGTTVLDSYGFQLELLQGTTYYENTASTAATRATDVLLVQGPTGTYTITYSDGSTASPSLTASGGVVTIPTATRPIRSIETPAGAGGVAAVAALSLGAVGGSGSARLALAARVDQVAAPIAIASIVALPLRGGAAMEIERLGGQSAGSLALKGSGGAALPPVTGAASATLALRGSLSAPLTPVAGVAAAAGRVTYAAALDGVLAPVATTAAAALRLSGSATSALGSIAALAEGRLLLRGSAAATLRAIGTALAAGSARTGGASATLGPVQLAATMQALRPVAILQVIRRQRVSFTVRR